MKTVQLSIAIITQNEAENLPDCLASAAFADEIVVVDSGSTDATCTIAQAHGARVIVHSDWPGFGPQKNRAIDACQGQWIMVLDADERISPQLQAQIQAALKTPQAAVYEMPRSSMYCGRFMRHGGWWPDYVRRLFKRGSARFSEAAVHETLISHEPVKRLTAPLLHYSFRSMEQVLHKMNRYSSDAVPLVLGRCRAPSLGQAVLHGLAAFMRTYFFKLGLLDGKYGFMLAVSNAEGSYYRYVKAMLATDTQTPSKKG
jgi:glycosyltransferase involved in cell wall biosynthesis